MPRRFNRERFPEDEELNKEFEEEKAETGLGEKGEEKKEEIEEEEFEEEEESENIEKYVDTLANAKHGEEKDIFSKIPEKYHNKIAKVFIDTGEVDFVGLNLHNFKNLDEECFNKLKKAGQNNKKLSWNKRMIENPEAFSEMDKNKFLLEEIKTGNDFTVSTNLDKYDNLSNEIAEELLDYQWVECISPNLEKFPDLDHKKAAKKLIENKHELSVLANREKFTGVSDEELIEMAKATGRNDFRTRALIEELGEKGESE